MARRLNWEKIQLERKPRRSLTEDREFMNKDVASAWLERRERWLVTQSQAAGMEGVIIKQVIEAMI
jgi:hypothetical protein